MAEAAAPEEKPSARVSSRRDAFLDLLFAVLNFVLSGPPGWRKRPQKPTQQQQVRLADYLWGMILGPVLLILNAGFYFQGSLAQFLGWNVLDGTGFFSVWLLYLLLCFFGFFLIGLLRGRATWDASAAARLSVTAGLVGILPVIIVSLIVGLVLIVRRDLAGAFFLADALSLAPILGASEILVSVGGVQLGRVIGSRFLYRRPRAEGSADT